ncbi:MAG: acyl-CoA thioesterase [Bacteroidia bacterium]
MISHIEKIRVRYGETDQMGYVYYGNYALYYEVGRVELLRKIGVAYSDLEKQGIGLPVSYFEIKYLKPVRYDDIIQVKTTISEIPQSRITFNYECTNDSNIVLNTGKVTLVFINIKTGKPIGCPKNLQLLFNSYLVE